ncbi:MAG: hypothetical protein JWM43_961 [Acidobacteriaceae bacterium]|nr:hypothetical protein [Acidobacteriaceae bacterium]
MLKNTAIEINRDEPTLPLGWYSRNFQLSLVLYA